MSRCTVAGSCHFYPRSPCGERQEKSLVASRPLRISIHALLAESDEGTLECLRAFRISIHALLAESDKARSKRINRNITFLSTLSLRRATAVQVVVVIVYALFLSTLSLRRATSFQHRSHQEWSDFYPRSPCGERHLGARKSRHVCGISIHALLAESDSQQPDGTTRTTYFYPRSPCGERPTDLHKRLIQFGFLSTLSLRRATAN